jgi:hypothetical protein
MPTPIVDEYLTIRTLNLGTRAHLRKDMGPVWGAPQRRSGGPRILGGEDGSLPRPVKTGFIRFLHEVWVDGRYSVEGAVNANPDTGWRTNLDALYTACAPETADPWTFTATHTYPGGSRTAAIQVLDIVLPRRFAGVAGPVTLDIVIPTGEWDASGGES